MIYTLREFVKNDKPKSKHATNCSSFTLSKESGEFACVLCDIKDHTMHSISKLGIFTFAKNYSQLELRTFDGQLYWAKCPINGDLIYDIARIITNDPMAFKDFQKFGITEHLSRRALNNYYNRTNKRGLYS